MFSCQWFLPNAVHTRPIPQGVQDLAVVPYPEQLVRHRDPVRVCSLGVPEYGVGQPDHPHHVAVECQFLHGAVISEAAVGPCLGEDDVNLVLLRIRRRVGAFMIGASR